VEPRKEEEEEEEVTFIQIPSIILKEQLYCSAPGTFMEK
jgi:hypothetical protein